MEHFKQSNLSNQFSHLSILDLIQARELFHFHLMNKRNVVATAIGRYLIRNSDMNGDRYQPKGYPKEPRRLNNSKVQDFSWPCVLVFVSEWADEKELINKGNDDIIPRSIYMPDGRVIPICIVEAPRSIISDSNIDINELAYNADKMGGGLPVMLDIQGKMYIATVGCLVSDGHRTYAITNKHVTGSENDAVRMAMNGQNRIIGFGCGKVLGKKQFSDVYAGWSSNSIMVNNDIGLIDVRDTKEWRTEIYGIGQMDELFDLNIQNLNLDLISKEVIGHGAISGPVEGEIYGLFYRYKSVGGEEYVSDFLIAGKDGSDLKTHHGDSGTLFMLLEEAIEYIDKKPVTVIKKRPIGILWGQHEFMQGGGIEKRAYALATCLSNVLREMDIDIIRGWDLAQDYTWGKTGHYGVGNKAIFAINGKKYKKLKTLFENNLNRISFPDTQLTKDIDKPENFDELYFGDFCPLADVPDLVWKLGPKGINRGQIEHPNHYCDIDYKGKKMKESLRSLVEKDNKNLSPAKWVEYYNSIIGEIPKDESDSRHKGDDKFPQNHWGLLPFRVWQIFDEMVEFLKQDDVNSFFCAAGLLTHYVGDACQPLHGSYMTNGDPFKQLPKVIHHQNGEVEKTKEPFAKGVHGGYEDKMLDYGIDEIMPRCCTGSVYFNDQDYGYFTTKGHFKSICCRKRKQ